ncbi:hypothetical protein [Pandoraea norimbergensis]|uniref:DUF2946 domain-containing protein n=1 Tax=Pandoraea norimbergensis TaxID=93219 RepID=A0ABN4JHS1_9BURK|nr:hypothetical protein [Pandoraea norimbergensis]ALS59899.1 hypothetical protein AT302_09165 [Pandoraea norimbergensis]
MPSFPFTFRYWRARLRAPANRGRSGWVAWLIVALLCVQMWGLQHEIVHARQLADTGVSAAAAATDNAADADADTDDDADAQNAWAPVNPSLAHTVYGSHHHCHLFEGATLAAAMAVAVLEWRADSHTDLTPSRATGRSHASALTLPFRSRAPPVTV